MEQNHGTALEAIVPDRFIPPVDLSLLAEKHHTAQT